MADRLRLAILLFIFPQSPDTGIEQACQAFNNLNTAIRDQRMGRQQAQPQWAHCINALYEKSKTYVDTATTNWVFPLRGYTYAAIGGEHGNGYMAKGFDYFDGNKHKGHAAHDIFIYDSDQDAVDDRNGKPVDVLAVINGIVIASDSSWQSKSLLRGGNYLYLYNPHTGELIYYAHNHRLLVKPGDRVHAGQKIAEVGRSGLNAAQKRSPTHLHITAFHVTAAGPVPYNCYIKLQKARLIN